MPRGTWMRDPDSGNNGLMPLEGGDDERLFGPDESWSAPWFERRQDDRWMP